MRVQEEGKFVHEWGVLCAELVVERKFVHEWGILCAELRGDAEVCALKGYSVRRVGCDAEVCALKGYSVRRVEVCAGETVRRLLLCVENGCLLHIVLLLCAIKWGI